LLDTPQFEVLGPVVVTAPVLVMHAFMWLKVTAEDLFHYENVLRAEDLRCRLRLE